MAWRVLEKSEPDVFKNLAVDEAIARTCASSDTKVNTLRFWKADNAVVIGRFQCVHEEVNLGFCEKHNIAIARRFTGGGAVFHDEGNLNFAVCGDQNEKSVSHHLMEFYDAFVGAVVTALNGLEIPAEYDRNRNCIRSNGKKITGTAGWIRRGVSFLHGTLLLSADLPKLEKSLRPVAGQPVYMRDRSRIRCKPSERDVVTNLSEVNGQTVDEQEVMNAIIEAVRDLTQQEMIVQELSSEERTASERLYQERYSQPSWNLGILAQTNLGQ
jgi:lipoate-protein ligase A